MGFGALFLLAFAGIMAEVFALQPLLETAEGVRRHIRRLKIGTTAMMIAAWGTVLTGTWIVYPWYREKVPTSPRSILLSSPDTELWHKFAFEWKEHVAWIAPILMTLVVFLVFYYGASMVKNDRIRKVTLAILLLTFGISALAGAIGAFVTKVAPVIGS
jgi:ABC-type uncharacterized transport system permease subunit